MYQHLFFFKKWGAHSIIKGRVILPNNASIDRLYVDRYFSHVCNNVRKKHPMQVWWVFLEITEVVIKFNFWSRFRSVHLTLDSIQSRGHLEGHCWVWIYIRDSKVASQERARSVCMGENNSTHGSVFVQYQCVCASLYLRPVWLYFGLGQRSGASIKVYWSCECVQQG